MFNFNSNNNASNFNFNSSSNAQQQQQQRPATSSLFPSTGSFGTGSSYSSQPTSLGQQPQQQQQYQPQHNSNLSMLSQQTVTGVTYPRETNFMDLPAELRQSIESLEKTIQGHADASRPFSNRVDPSQQLLQIEDKLSLLEEKISAYSCLHAQQNSKILNLKKTTSAHWRYSENTARTIEASRTSVNSGGKVTWSRAFAPNDPTALHYEEILKEMDDQLLEAEGMCDALKKQIEPFVSSATSNQAISSPTESIKFLLKTEAEIFSAIQRRYTQIHDEMDLMRKNYRNFCIKFRKDSRDPFAPKVVESKAKESERQAKPSNFFGVTHPTAYPTSQQQASSAPFPSSTSSLLPSATTGLPTRLSSGFSFGSRN